MFRIGEFSRIAQTPISQLRYYDEIGLFQPGHTDKFTRYRYYSATQLPDLNRILALKELGLTLEQIKRLVRDDVSAEEIRGMLTLKKAQVEKELHEQVERLHHIEARLRQVEQGESAVDDILLKEVPAQRIYSVRVTLPELLPSAIQHLSEMLTMLPRHIPEQTLGHFTAIFHEEAFVFQNADAELGFLLNDDVSEPLELSSGHKLTMRTLPPIEMAASVVRVGGFENGFESYGNLGRWVEANGYRMSGPVREIFIVTPNLINRIEENVCEIQIPVTPEQRPALP